MSFWDKPREQRWRGWIFRIHLWSGLLIGLWALAMGLSGSALVFKHEIEAYVEPEVFAVEPKEGAASLDAVVAEIARRHPEYGIGTLRDLDQTHRSHVARISRPGEPALDAIHVHFDPYTGQILGEYRRRDGVLGFFQNLHYFLLLGPTGIQINGALGAVLTIMCATGLIIWWPGSRQWRSALTVKRSGNWKRTNYDLHRTAGFFAAGFLAIFGTTAIYFGFPTATVAALATATGGDIERAQRFTAAPKSEVADGEPYSLDALVARADELLPSGTRLAYIRMPSSPGASMTVAGRRPGNELFRGWAGSDVDQYTGRVLRRFDSREEGFAVQAAQMVAPLHFGSWGGAWSKTLWFAIGFSPGALFLTGFLMWWNRVAVKRLRAR